MINFTVKGDKIWKIYLQGFVVNDLNLMHEQMNACIVYGQQFLTLSVKKHTLNFLYTYTLTFLIRLKFIRRKSV